MQKFWLVNKVSPSTAELLVYGFIGDGEEAIDAAGFTNDLRALEQQYANINVRINCYGGSIFDGLTIYNALRNSRSVINTYIDGVAASMGSVIALAGKKVFMSKVARWMSHRATSLAVGNADDLRSTANILDGLEDSVSQIYASRTGLSLDDAKAKYITPQDRWLNAQQCLDERLIDGIYDAEAVELPAQAAAATLHGIYNQILQPPTQNMAKIILSSVTLLALGLSAIAATEGVDASLLDAKIGEMSGRITTAEAAKLKAEKDLADLKAETAKKEITAILASGVDAKKLTVELSAKLEKQFSGKPDDLKELVDAMPAYQSITASLKQGDLSDEFKDKTYRQLLAEGKLEALKMKHPMHYDELAKNKGA